MDSRSRTILGTLISIGIVTVCFVLFHLGGTLWQYAQLVSALVGGSLTLYATLAHKQPDEAVEPWQGHEKIAWILIGCGLLLWGCGESIWRYYSSIHQTPFPSLADLGYASLPPLIFAGLILQPSSGIGTRRLLILLDSLITMCAMLSIGWYLLLGSLALASSEHWLAKFLGLYYPTTDIAMLTCIVLLLFRGQGSLYQATARRVSLIIVGAGLCFFASSDFIFNVKQNAGIYTEGSWTDLGWSIGMLAIGAAAYLRRFLPLTSRDMIEQRLQSPTRHFSFGFAQIAMYSLLVSLLMVLVLNTFSQSSLQVAIRPVLVLGTVVVVALVVIRHVLTVYENARLLKWQATALEKLEAANQHIEEQSLMITKRNAELEEGIIHLKDVQSRIANGNLRARARLHSGELLPLAVGLNLMVERLAHLEQAYVYVQRLTRALQELCSAIEHYRNGKPFVLPPSCRLFPEINRLVYAFNLREKFGIEDQRQGHSFFSTKAPVPVHSLQKKEIPQTQTDEVHSSSPQPSILHGMRVVTPVPSSTESLQGQSVVDSESLPPSHQDRSNVSIDHQKP